MGFFDNVVSVVIDNKIVQSIKTTDGGVIYEKGNGTFLTIDVPMNLVYSDAFNITGTLKDSNQTGLSGETVKLKVGNTVVDSTTTTTGGAYSFTQTPVATGNHSFQVVYEGSVTYNASQSSIVNRVVGKETTVLTVANPTDNYMTYDSNISFTGRLTDDEGNPLSGKTISITGAYVTYTVTTQSDGSFSTSKAYGSGTWNFTISFEGDSNYTSSSVNRSVMIREHDYDISISADKPTLSYSDNDSCTVTCLLTDNHVAIEGETLSYVIKHGATVIDSGSDTTDSNGEISFTYSATGVGDVTIEVDYSTLLQEIFVLEDCINYDPLTSNSGKWTIPSGVSSTYSSDGWNVSATSYGQVKLTDKLTSDCSVEFTLVNYNIVSAGSSCLIYAYTNGETTPNKVIVDSRSSAYSTSAVFGRALDHRFANGTKFRIEYTSSTLKVYENDVLIATDPNSVGLPTRFEFHIGTGGRTATYKNLKVKAL